MYLLNVSLLRYCINSNKNRTFKAGKKLLFYIIISPIKMGSNFPAARYIAPIEVYKGNNKLTELRTILQRESQNL